MTVAEAHSILQVQSDVPPETLRDSYRTLVKHWHPDHCRDAESRTVAEDRMREIIEAYRLLSEVGSDDDEVEDLEDSAPIATYDSDDHEVTAAIVSFLTSVAIFGIGMWIVTTHIVPRGLSSKATAMSFVVLFAIWGILYGYFCPVFEQSARKRAQNKI